MKKFLITFMGAVCLAGLLLLPGYEVQAESMQGFTGEAVLLKEEKDSCRIQVEVGSSIDFDGVVRLRFTGGNMDNCSFEQEITIPAGGEKQYTVTIPKSNVEQTRGNGTLNFVNRKGKTLATIPFRDLLNGQTSAVQVGILSDDADSLDYLDMGGEVYSIGDQEKPIRLVELSKDTVTDALDSLYFLVIDQYDTSVLDSETVKEIEEWVDDGGCLIIGTGEYGKETLSGFGTDFMLVQANGTSEPGENNSVSAGASNGSYYNFTHCGIRFDNMAVADLQFTGSDVFETAELPALIYSRNRGGVAVYSISLGDGEMKKADTEMVRVIYDGIIGNTMDGGYGTEEEWGFLGMDLFGLIDHIHTKLNFTFPKILILLYVVLIGPVLYLILRVAKKREWYWGMVPALAFVFVGVLFLYGQSVKVNRTRLYSVAVQEASGKDSERVQTYFSGYHSGTKPWSVKLKDDYTYAGACMTRYGSGTIGDKDHYFVRYGDGIEMGMNPASNFETGYLYASGTKPGQGTIEGEQIMFDGQTCIGTITNHTSCDFPYLYVRSDEYFMAIKDVKAGETIDLAKVKSQNRVVYESQYPQDVYYELQNNVSRNDMDPDLQAALCIGMYAANTYRDRGQVLVCGIVPDDKKNVSGKCKEISYGCLFANVRQEVGHASN